MGCRNVFVGCGVFALLATIALGIGAYFVWQWAAPAVTAIGKLPADIERTVRGATDIGANVREINGQRSLELRMKVPFNPNDASVAEPTVREIVRIVREDVPVNLGLQRLEVRLYRDDGKGGRTERVFKFDLTKPNAPAIRI